ncbi:MAG: PilZ domain-containing protein [Syntrophobacterales bacterium]|jgi:hypothetical protein
MSVGTERRRHPRIAVNWPVIVVTPQLYIGGEAANISIGGVNIRCTRDPEGSGPLRMAFQIPDREEFLQVTGVVAWSHAYEEIDDFYSWETGIRFTSFIGDGRKYLFDVITDISNQSK